MKVMILGGVSKADGSFVQRLAERGVQVGEWREAKSRALRTDDVLPSWCDGIIALRTLCSHAHTDAARALAKSAGVPFACVDHKWAHAEPVLTATGMLLPAAAPAPAQGEEMPLPDTLPAQNGKDALQPAQHGLLTRTEVAELLGVDVSRIGQLEEEGKLPCVAIGSRRRKFYAPDDVERLMAQREAVLPVPQPPQDPDDALLRVLSAVREYSDARVAALTAQVADLTAQLSAARAEAAILRTDHENLKARLRGLIA